MCRAWREETSVKCEQLLEKWVWCVPDLLSQQLLTKQPAWMSWKQPLEILFPKSRGWRDTGYCRWVLLSSVEEHLSSRGLLWSRGELVFAHAIITGYFDTYKRKTFRVAPFRGSNQKHVPCQTATRCQLGSGLVQCHLFGNLGLPGFGWSSTLANGNHHLGSLGKTRS